MSSRRRSKAFTLVEVLVVITVVAMLLSLFLPTISKARETAQTAMCQSNLRQNMVGAFSYTNDSKDALLPRSQYVGYVMPGFTYMLDTGNYWARKAWICPTTPSNYEWQYWGSCNPWSKVAGAGNANYPYANFWGSNPNADYNDPTGTYYYVTGAIDNAVTDNWHPWYDNFNTGTTASPVLIPWFTMKSTMINRPEAYAELWDQDLYRPANLGHSVTTRTHVLNPGRAIAFADGHVRFLPDIDQGVASCTANSYVKGIEEISPIMTAAYQVNYYSPQYGPTWGHGTGYWYNGYCGAPRANQATLGILSLTAPIPF